MTDKNQPVAYEPHPVTPQRKKELRAKGYKIIDAVFAPVGYLRQDGPTVVEFVAAGYLASNYPPSGYATRSTEQEIAEAIAAQASEGQARSVSSGAATAPDPAQPPADDDLDALGAEQLHTMAKERGVSVHHKAGADKVREALRKAAQDGAEA